MNFRSAPGSAPDQTPWTRKGSSKHLGLITLSILLAAAFLLWLI
jgi:hypothetical protein